MAYIYKITNIINNKCYIGKTVLSIEKRFLQHKRDSKRRHLEKRPLYNAFNKYGVDNFVIEQIEECSPEVMSEREQYWICFYDSYYNGYNAALGGEGKLCFDYKQIYDLWQKGLQVQEIKKQIGCSYDTIRSALNQYNIPTFQRQQRIQQDKFISVAQIDKNTDEIINIFPSIADAAREINKLIGKGHISDVCHGRRDIAYGYKWKFI